MKFKFYPIESRIYNFLEFPTLIFAKEHYEEKMEDDDIEVPSFVRYFEFLSRVEKRLKPYKKDIEVFYKKEFMGDYDFIELISKVYRIFGHKSEKEYLDMLLGLNEQDIITSIAYGVIYAHDRIECSEEVMTRARALSLDKTELISLIKELPTESASKWDLFLYTEEPLKHMKMYVELMNTLLPIFEEFYSLYEEEVNGYGQYLVDFLNENGAKGLEEKTYSILDSKILNEEENNIFVSAMMQFAISLSSPDSKYNYIVWGLMMEDAFKRMKEKNENKINERVQVFKNLGDKTRYEVVKLIASGETSTKKIARALGVSSATISYHISNLLQAKIIKIDRTENRYGYLIDHELLENVINGLKEDLS